MTTPNNILRITFALAALATSVSAQSFSTTFSSDPFGSTFTQSPGTGINIGTVGSWSNSIGVGGVSGRINTDDSSGGHNDGAFYSTSITKDATFGTTYSVSIYFLSGSGANVISQAMAGFIRSTSSTFNGSGGGASTVLRYDGGATNRAFIGFRDTSSATIVNQSATFVLTANTWYQLSFSMKLNSNTSADLSATLYNWGADGVTGGTAVTNASISQTSFTLGNSGISTTSFYAAFGGGNNSGNGTLAAADQIQAFDNFAFAASAIPEPSSFAAVAGLGALGLVGLRRRRRS